MFQSAHAPFTVNYSVVQCRTLSLPQGKSESLGKAKIALSGTLPYSPSKIHYALETNILKECCGFLTTCAAAPSGSVSMAGSTGIEPVVVCLLL